MMQLGERGGVSTRINNAPGENAAEHNNTLIARSGPGMTHSPASDASDQCLTQWGGGRGMVTRWQPDNN